MCRPRTVTGPSQAHLRGELLQGGDAIFGRWMSREQIVHTLPRQGIDNEQMGSCRILFSWNILDLMRGFVDLGQRRSKGFGLPLMRAPILSAAYSRVRLIAICTSIAARGASTTITSVPIAPMPPWPLLSRWPPLKSIPNCANIEMRRQWSR
jgi:hypothetical protein